MGGRVAGLAWNLWVECATTRAIGCLWNAIGQRKTKAKSSWKIILKKRTNAFQSWQSLAPGIFPFFIILVIASGLRPRVLRGVYVLMTVVGR